MTRFIYIMIIRHDKTTAAVWFAENVLWDRFRQLAKVKQFDISAFNAKNSRYVFKST